MLLSGEIVNVQFLLFIKLTTRELLPSLTTSIFTETKSFEAVHECFHCYCLRFVALGSMAGIATYIFNIRCLYPFVMA